MGLDQRGWGKQVHFFQDIGYRHNSYKHCPAVRRNNCACDAMEAVAFHSPAFGVCHRRWQDVVAAQGAKAQLHRTGAAAVALDRLGDKVWPSM